MKYRQLYQKNKFKIKQIIFSNYQIFLQKYYYKIPIQNQEKVQDSKENTNTISKTFRFPFQKYPELNEHLQQYFTWENFKSDRSVTHYDTVSNLLFVTGPQNIGKSTFINYNIRTLEMESRKKMEKNFQNLQQKKGKKSLFLTEQQTKQSLPLITQIDFSQFKHIINFNTFLQTFEESLIQGILSRDQFLTSDNLYEIFKDRFHEQYISIFFKDSIYGLINDMDLHFQVSDEIKGKLALEVFYPYLDYEMDLKEAFSLAVEIINQENQQQGTLNLITSIIYRLEHEYRKNDKIMYRTGIELSDFLLDCYNFLAGYHPLNNQRICDTVLIFTNQHLIFENYIHDIKINDFFDHINLRLYTDENKRTHFPIIIESNQSRQIIRENLSMMHVVPETFPIIELTGYQAQDIDTNLGVIFQHRILGKLKDLYGLHIRDWENVIRLISQDKNGLNKSLNLDFSYIEKEYIIFKNKINSVKLDNLVSEELDDNTIDYQVLDILEEMTVFSGIIYVGDMSSEQYFVNKPIVKAMTDKNILYGKYYLPQYQFSKKLYGVFAERYLKEAFKNMNISEKYKYRRWKKKNGVDSTMFRIEKTPLSFRDQENNPKNTNTHEIYSYYNPRRPHMHYLEKNIFGLQMF